MYVTDLVLCLLSLLAQGDTENRFRDYTSSHDKGCSSGLLGLNMVLLLQCSYRRCVTTCL